MKLIIEDVDNGYLITDESNKDQVIQKFIQDDEDDPCGDLMLHMKVCKLIGLYRKMKLEGKK